MSATAEKNPSPLTRSVFTAYLGPLLEKHEKGQVLVHEDLTASWQAAESVLKQNATAPDAAAVVSIDSFLG